jgi:general stress protein YciG
MTEQKNQPQNAQPPAPQQQQQPPPVAPQAQAPPPAPPPGQQEAQSAEERKYWSRKSTHHLWPQIADMVRSGKSMRQAAAELNVSYETAARACRAAGIVRRRGFGSMDPELQRQIAQKGGRAAQAQGKVHHFTSEEASAAGKKGWKVSPRSPDHMRRIGKMGGQASVVARHGVSPRSLHQQQDRPQHEEHPGGGRESNNPDR